MRKLVSLISVIVLVIGMLAGCGAGTAGQGADNNGGVSSNSTVSNGTANPEQSTQAVSEDGSLESYYAKIQPLNTPTKLRIGLTQGVLHGLPSVIPEMLGVYKKLGLNVEILYFSNGPLMVEALASDGWDCGSYGIGGTLGGPISQNALIVGLAVEEQAGQAIFVRRDSDIAKAGELPNSPGVYGNTDTWKGKEIYIPTGTTLQYVLGKGLKLMGLTDKDVKLTNMDAGNVNTAAHANQGDIWALWNNYAYADDVNTKYLKAMDGNTVGATLVASLTANPKSFNDPVKRDAIKKWEEIYFTTVDWLKSDPKNVDKFVDYYKQWDDEQGVKAEVSDLKKMVDNTPFYTLEDNYKMFTEKFSDGSMLAAEDKCRDPLDFFIEAGNYKPEDKQKFLDNKFKADLLEELYNSAK